MFDHRHLAAALESVSSVPAEPIAPGAGSDGYVLPGSRHGGYRDPRRRMLDALIETVARRGYERTTIDRVLALAEVPAAVFEEYFEDKQDCLLQALDELVEEFERAVLERLHSPAPWPERIRVGLETLLAALARDPDYARVALVECLSAGEPALARLRAALGACVPILEHGRAYAASAEQGEARATSAEQLPQQTSEAVVGGIASIVHRHVLEERTAELPTLLGDLLYFALMPYLGHRRALIAAGLGTAEAL